MKTSLVCTWAAAVVTAAFIVRMPLEERARAQAQPQDPEWRELGPYGMPWPESGRYPGNGRVNAIAFHPTNPDIIWIGAATGGVWRSADNGETWQAIGDRLPNMGVSSIAVDPRSPHTMYVATGDGDWRRNYEMFSGGILESSDELRTVHASLPFHESQRIHVRRVLIHPDNPDVLMAATSHGIYRRQGGTWGDPKLPLPPNYRFEPNCSLRWREELCQGFVDLAVAQVGQETWWYAALWGVGVYRSKDSGDTWTLLNVPIPPPATSHIGRIALAVAPKHEQTAYAVVINANDSGWGDALLGIFRTDNGGDSWSPTTAGPGYVPGGCDSPLVSGDRCLIGTQADFDLAVAVSPANPNHVILGAQELFESTDGGGTWTLIAGYNGVHPDYHALAFEGTDGRTFLAANDGGVWRFSRNELTNTWTPADLNRTLAVSQAWRATGSTTDRSIVLAGLHDNGYVLYEGPPGPLSHVAWPWDRVAAGDGADCVMTSPTGATRQCRGLVLNTPVPITRVTQTSTLFRGTNGFGVEKIGPNDLNWRVANVGMTNEVILHFLVASPSDPKVMYAFGQAAGPRIWRSDDYGERWHPFVCNGCAGTGGVIPTNPMPGSDPWLTSLAVEPDNPNAVWVGYAEWFNVNGSGNKIWRFDGTDWHTMGAGLASIPVRVLVTDPDGNVYAGTERGVYVYRRGSAEWKPYGTGLPNVVVRDLEVTSFGAGFSCLLAATWGRGVWQACEGLDPGAPPQEVSALSFYSHSVPVYWTAPGTTPQFYEVFRKPPSAPDWAWQRLDYPCPGMHCGGRITGPSFRDETAQDNVNYVYKVVAKFADWDSAYGLSPVAQARMRLPQNLSEIIAAAGTPPVLDGTVNPAEWADAQSVPMTDASDGDSKPVNAWVKYHGQDLYIAVVDQNVSKTANRFQLIASVDWNGDRAWPETATQEGWYVGTGAAPEPGSVDQYGRYFHTGEWPSIPIPTGDPVSDSSSDYAFGLSGGAAHHEMRITIPPEARHCGATARCFGLVLQSAENVPGGDIVPYSFTGLWPYGAQTFTKPSRLLVAAFAFGDVRLIDVDVNRDGALTCDDLKAVKASFGKRGGQIGFDPAADVNGDGVVDVRDVALVAQRLPANQPCK